jgi:hypothetical protein
MSISVQQTEPSKRLQSKLRRHLVTKLLLDDV